jgi:site-specific DNA-cytosine methylase
MKVMWDVCSGLGGASEAFLACPGWMVIRIENNPILQGVENTHNLDVLQWQSWVDEMVQKYGKPDLIWASPTCTQFSEGYNAPGPVARRAGLDFEPDMSLVFACQDLIDYVQPQYWVIENVKGAIKHFTPHLGEFSQRISSFYLWGLFPTILMPEGWRHSKNDGDVHSANPLRSNLRGMIPYDLSKALYQAITEQTTLKRWL